jgi:hypothetical protein
MSVCVSDVILTLASWAGCLWLGFQIGTVRSEQRHRADVGELERRFKIVDCKVVETPGAETVEARP